MMPAVHCKSRCEISWY